MENNRTEATVVNRIRRPAGIWVLIVIFLYLAIAGLARAAGAIRFWGFLSGLPLSVSPFYIALSGLAWGVAGLATVAGLWAGRVWAPWAARGAGIFFLTTYWVDLIGLARPDANRANWPFMAGASVVFYLVILWALYGPAARAYFSVK